MAELGFTFALMFIYVVIEKIYDWWTKHPTRQRESRESKDSQILKEDENE